MDGIVRTKSVLWMTTAIVISVFATLLVMQEWRADAAPGDDDATWVPVEPCRLFDNRPSELPTGGKKTPLAAGSPATQQVTGTVGNCNIPTTGVIGISMNVTVVNGTAQSNLRLYPADASQPLVSNLNWKAGDSATANKVDVKLSPAGQLKLANFSGSVDVIGDIVGYYTNSSLKELAQGQTDLQNQIDQIDQKTLAPITMVQGPWGWTVGSINPASDLDNYTLNGTAFKSDGRVGLALTGPTIIGNEALTLTQVTYCISLINSGAKIVSATISSFEGTTGALASTDFTERAAKGCYTVEVTEAAQQGDSFSLVLNAGGDTTKTIAVTTVTTVWETRQAP